MHSANKKLIMNTICLKLKRLIKKLKREKAQSISLKNSLTIIIEVNLHLLNLGQRENQNKRKINVGQEEDYKKCAINFQKSMEVTLKIISLMLKVILS